MSEATAVVMSVTEMPLEDLKQEFIGTKDTISRLSDDIEPARAELQRRIADLTEEFNEGNKMDLAMLAASETHLEAIEAELRNRAIAHYESTGQKSLDANLGVRVTTKYIYETEKAVEWAETNAPVMIVKSVDKKAFEALPTLTELDFVSVEAKTSAVIKGL